MTPQVPHLFNVVPPQQEGSGLTVHFYAGDILSIPSDILVVSAFRESYHPVPHTLFGQLHKRFEFLVYDHPLERISEHLSLLRPNQGQLPFRKMLIAEMDHSLQYDRNIIQATFQDLRHHVLRTIEPQDQKISFPLLGTGNQGLSKEQSAIEILKLASVLSDSPLRRMQVFAYDFEAIALLNTNIDTFLRRPEPARSSDPLIQAVVQELEVCESEGRLSDCDDMRNFLQLIRAPYPSLRAVAAVGRNVAECFVERMIHHHGIRVEEPSTLENSLRALKDVFRTYPAYVQSYLRLLQSCGNIGSHSSAHRLESQDIAALAMAVISLSRELDDIH